MKWLHENWFKIACLLVALVLGLGVNENINSKQRAASVQAKRDYIGKRKMECYEILNKERAKEQEQHYRVVKVEYFEPSDNPYEGKDFNDSCRVEYEYVISNSTGKTETMSEFKSF